NRLLLYRIRERGNIMSEMVRVNTRVSADMNSWLDSETEKTGIPKSTQIMIALEQYKTQKEAMKTMQEILALAKEKGDTETLNKMAPLFQQIK
ncbi:hypothetical protein, partial [Alkalibacterium kapii]